MASMVGEVGRGMSGRTAVRQRKRSTGQPTAPVGVSLATQEGRHHSHAFPTPWYCHKQQQGASLRLVPARAARRAGAPLRPPRTKTTQQRGWACPPGAALEVARRGHMWYLGPCGTCSCLV